MAWDVGCEWYQSIFPIYISAVLKKIFKGARPFKQQKTFWATKERLKGLHRIKRRPGLKSESRLYRKASVRRSLISGFTFENFHWFILKNRGVGRSAISVIAD